jgi:lipopolysaccharide heptosyltransferase II
MDRKRILIFNVNWLGDVLFSTATIRNIRYNYPDSFIACVIPTRCNFVLKDIPHVDEIINFDEKGLHKGMLEKLRFVKLLRSKKFDIVFLLHRSFSRALICRLARIPQRIGYHTKKRAFLMTKEIIPPDRDSMHRLEYYLTILRKAGLKVKDRYTEFMVSEADKEFVDVFLNSNSAGKNDFLVGVNPGGNWLPKRWPAEYWAKLCDALPARVGCKVVITGGPLDMALVDEIRSSMKEKPIVAAGAMDLKQLGALCKKLDVFITADTGPLHIANAVGAKKIIALFGPTSPEITGPLPADNTVIIKKDVGCKIPCYIVECADNRCMKAITVDEVIEKVKEITSKK